MPDAKNNAKLTGDTHLPDVESGLEEIEGQSPQGAGTTGTPSDRGRKTELGREGQAGRGIRHGGELKDRDAPTSDTYGNTRDSGETGSP